MFFFSELIKKNKRCHIDSQTISPKWIFFKDSFNRFRLLVYDQNMISAWDKIIISFVFISHGRCAGGDKVELRFSGDERWRLLFCINHPVRVQWVWPSRVLAAWYQVKLLRVNGRDNDSSGPGAPGLIKEYYAKGMVFFRCQPDVRYCGEIFADFVLRQ